MESDIDKDDADYIPDMYSSSERDWDVGLKARIQKAIDFSIEMNDNEGDENLASRGMIMRGMKMKFKLKKVMKMKTKLKLNEVMIWMIQSKCWEERW